jgi:hypothetical protein
MHRHLLNQIRPAGNIAATGAQTAAGILDQGSGTKINPCMAGFLCLDNSP